jgi:hypothetical protein
MELPQTIFYDFVIFIEKNLWGINGGEKVKFGGQNEWIHGYRQKSLSLIELKPQISVRHICNSLDNFSELLEQPFFDSFAISRIHSFLYHRLRYDRYLRTRKLIFWLTALPEKYKTLSLFVSFLNSRPWVMTLRDWTSAGPRGTN